MHRVILHGSPRVDGRSAALADELFCACIEECPDDGVSIVSVASTTVGPCTGCDACRAEAAEPLFLYEEGDPLMPCATVVESGACFHPCVIDDDMAEVRKHLDAADELVVVCPVYFADVPAQMKALLDRLQPYYFTDLRTRPKRPATIHVVGEGGDPHGFEPLIGTVRSALSVAGFTVELVLNWAGKIRADGEIIADAEEYPLPPVGGFGALDLGDYEFVEAEPDVEPWVGADAEPWGGADAATSDAPGTSRRGGLQPARPADGRDASHPPEAPRRGGLQPARSIADDAGDAPRPRATLSVTPSAAPAKESPRKKAAKGPRKSSGKGDPAYGRKNTKKKGNGRGGHR